MGSRIAWGAGGGVCGVLAGHFGVWLAHRWTGDANIWFQGPHGVPFFDLALSTGLYYGCLGAALAIGGRGWRVGWILGFVSSFVSFVLPMTLSTWIFSWGDNPADGETKAWV